MFHHDTPEGAKRTPALNTERTSERIRPGRQSVDTITPQPLVRMRNAGLPATLTVAISRGFYRNREQETDGESGFGFASLNPSAK